MKWTAADAIKAAHPGIDLLIDNAGAVSRLTGSHRTALKYRLTRPVAGRMVLSNTKNTAYTRYPQLCPLPGAMINRNAYRKPVD